ncbi:hypothetical protein HHI36_006211, partial [Cryptolaemus montrouzieri]
QDITEKAQSLVQHYCDDLKDDLDQEGVQFHSQVSSNKTADLNQQHCGSTMF